ncbi:hypothetical protein HMPREF0198_2550 [Cardiobacterium hominis ATCC 15826]|uniref:Uncharacterized protein n=1 Tax=Cardiobacterium hominis (strain ATCC 15826 / DSM 8339 / NCTC 10426 / 6573) TaxID=638300 RepID=C8NDH2_CARH6|nr:hypothetical protein HMPREF0198_2550 [Cardiobacterium hominis ATCC 15826]
MLKADTFALVKTKNLPPCDGFFCTTPAFIPLGREASIYPAWREASICLAYW